MSRSRRTTAERLREESGNALITVIIVSMIMGALTSVALSTGRQATSSSASDRNSAQSLGVAEAGLNEVMARVTDEIENGTTNHYWSLQTGQTLPSGCAAGGTCVAAKNDTTGTYTGTTPQGTYWFWVSKIANGFIVDVESKSGGDVLGRKRHIQVQLTPPARFDHDEAYALFSNTTINLSNNDAVLKGNVFANQSVIVQQNTSLQGSVTAATGYVQLQNGVNISGNVWSGGYNPQGPYGVSIGNGTVTGSVMASASDVHDCPSSGGYNHNYDINVSNGSILGGYTTLGSLTGSPGTVSGTTSPATCTPAAPTQQPPTFTFNPNNYDAATYHQFDRIIDFQSWLASNSNNLVGTFLVGYRFQNESLVSTDTPSETNRVDLSSANLTGSTTIVTNAPIYTGQSTSQALNDSNMPAGGGTLTLVSHYVPDTTKSACSLTDPGSECSVFMGNGFTVNSGSCTVATLVYADHGPVALKNGSTQAGNMCGSVISDAILVKNQETITYDQRIDKVVGFGPTAYAVTRWEELPAV